MHGPGVLALYLGKRHRLGGVLRELRERGLERVLLLITDGLPGLAEAIVSLHPLARLQRYVMHRVQCSLSQVKPRDRPLFTEELKRVSKARTRPGRWRRWGS
jgi:transposase-like protein